MCLLDCGGLRREDVAQVSSQWRGYCSSDDGLALIPESYSFITMNLKNMAYSNRMCVKLSHDRVE